MKDLQHILVYKKNKKKTIPVPVQYGFDIKAQGNKRLVTPFAQAAWSKVSPWWRSLVYNRTGEVISVGLPKFWDEDDYFTDVEYIENSFSAIVFREKQDGKLLIRTVDKNKVWWRSRNSFYAEDYSSVISQLTNDSQLSSPDFLPDHSLQFELCLPTERIIIKHDQPRLFLLGGAEHRTLTPFTQEQLSKISQQIQTPLSPSVQFTSWNQLTTEVKEWQEREGVVGYDKQGTPIVRVKSHDYNFRFKLRFDYPPGMLKKLGDKRFKQITENIEDPDIKNILQHRFIMIKQTENNPQQWGVLRDKFEQESLLSWTDIKEKYAEMIEQKYV